MTSSRIVASAAITTALALLAGCGGADPGTFNPSGGQAASQTAERAPAGKTAPPDRQDQPGGKVKMAEVWARQPAKRKVQKAYIAWQRAYNAAGAIPDPGYKPWASRMTPALHSKMRKGIASMRADGVAQKGAVTVHPLVTVVRGDTALLQDCLDQSGVAFYRDGKRVQRVDTKLIAFDVELVHKNGRWLVSSYKNTNQGQCEPYKGGD